MDIGNGHLIYYELLKEMNDSGFCVLTKRIFGHITCVTDKWAKTRGHYGRSHCVSFWEFMADFRCNRKLEICIWGKCWMYAVNRNMFFIIYLVSMCTIAFKMHRNRNQKRTNSQIRSTSSVMFYWRDDLMMS